LRADGTNTYEPQRPATAAQMMGLAGERVKRVSTVAHRETCDHMFDVGDHTFDKPADVVGANGVQDFNEHRRIDFECSVHATIFPRKWMFASLRYASAVADAKTMMGSARE
jgi:hypothetical protein